MTRGDQIYVMRHLAGIESLYEHHGIDCGDGSVIHYYKGGGDPVISRTSLETFALGNLVYRKDFPVSYIPDVVIQRAESRLGERQYNLLNNNCEHFATWCKTGRNQSQQLATYGLDVSQIHTPDALRLISAVTEEGDPVRAIAQLQQAMGNVSSAEMQLQAQYQQVQTEMDTWQRTAQLALQKGREDLARAALARKVELKRKATSLQQQLAEAQEIRQSIDRSNLALKRQLTSG